MTTTRDDSGHGAPSGVTRREAVQRVMGLMGGLALIGGERAWAFAPEPGALAQAMAVGVGAFSAADVALLDEIAETLLPETSTPGAKAARTGAFMALMVTDVYSERDRQVFRDGMRAARRRVPRGQRRVVPAGHAGAAAHVPRRARPRAEDGDGRTRQPCPHALSRRTAGRPTARPTTSG